jgi:hypothetical protein
MVVETDPVDFANLETEIKTLLKLAEMDDEAGLLRKLTALVPGYVNGQSPVAKRQKRVERILIVESDSKKVPDISPPSPQRNPPYPKERQERKRGADRNILAQALDPGG